MDDADSIERIGSSERPVRHARLRAGASLDTSTPYALAGAVGTLHRARRGPARRARIRRVPGLEGSAEVSDAVWQGMGIVGAAAGFVAFWGNPLALVLWLLVSLWALEHLFPWDTPLERCSERLPAGIEIAVYVGVLGTVIFAAINYDVGGSGVPVAILAVAASVLLARGLFEIGVLYGGADAKALMMAGLLLPIASTPLWSPAVAAGLLAYYPFALTVLIDAALFAIVVPIAIAVRNVFAHEFTFPRGFTGYTIPVEELPERFVWIKDPTFNSYVTDDEPEPQTTEEDRALRQRQADELGEARGEARLGHPAASVHPLDTRRHLRRPRGGECGL